MNKLLQVLCYAVSLALVVWLMFVFDFLLTAEPYAYNEFIPGKPLPASTLFVIHNPCAFLWRISGVGKKRP